MSSRLVRDTAIAAAEVRPNDDIKRPISADQNTEETEEHSSEDSWFYRKIDGTYTLDF